MTDEEFNASPWNDAVSLSRKSPINDTEISTNDSLVNKDNINNDDLDTNNINNNINNKNNNNSQLLNEINSKNINLNNENINLDRHKIIRKQSIGKPIKFEDVSGSDPLGDSLLNIDNNNINLKNNSSLSLQPENQNQNQNQTLTSNLNNLNINSNDINNSLTTESNLNDNLGFINKSKSINIESINDNTLLNKNSNSQNKLNNNNNNNNNNSSKICRFTITVGDPTKVGDITSAHTVYLVVTKTNSKAFRNSECSVSRRYKDFRWLYHALQDNNPGYIIPPPPDKQAVGRFAEDFVETRRAALENMLNKITSHPVLQLDKDLQLFLESETFNIDIKHRKINSIDDKIESSSSSFISTFGGAFSFTSKYVETDEWFIEKKGFIENLDSHLRGLAKSLEIIVTQRRELSDSTAEFSKTIYNLSQVEISKSLTNTLIALSEVESRIKDVHSRQGLQDMLTLGATLEEYIRLIESIRQSFAQRHKLFYAWKNSESDLNKKRATFDKLRSQGKTQRDRLAILEQEIGEAERKSANTRVAFDDIGKVLHSEFERFAKERIDDFHASVETFLETAVETQKEAIEIWETFYSRQGFAK